MTNFDATLCGISLFHNADFPHYMVSLTSRLYSNDISIGNTKIVTL